MDLMLAISAATKALEGLKLLRDNTISVRGLTYELDSKGGPQGMAFCPRCESEDGRFIRIVTTHRSKGPNIAVCPHCKADYGMQTGYTYEIDRRPS
jgi:hypothetical protein